MLRLFLFLLLCAFTSSTSFSYSLDSYSNLPYKRVAIPYQYNALISACEFLHQYAPDIMVMDCTLEQLYTANSLVIVGLLLANQSQPEQQATGYALLDQVSNVMFAGSPVLPLNDVWGYDDPITGRSYALIGAVNGVHIVDVTVPQSPVPVYFYQGVYTLWRDIKIWNSTLYAVNDNNFGSIMDQFTNVNKSYLETWKQGDGLVIIDLTYALQPHFANKTTEFFATAHNIQIEYDWTKPNVADCTWCRPYAYVVGQSMDNKDQPDAGGFLVLDLTNRLQPTKVGEWTETYIHDIAIQYRADLSKYIGYGCAIYSEIGNPGLYIIDVTNPSKPVTLASYNAAYNWTHNAWPTDDGKILYVTHEDENAPITIWDVSDVYHAKQVGELFITPGNENISAHNVFVRGNRLWVSYYSIGSAVYDITDPVNPALIDIYDTSPDIAYGMGGTWGIYPYAKNHLVYATDMSNGFFVLNLTATPVVSFPDRGIETGVLVFIILSAIVNVLTIGGFIIFVRKVIPQFRYNVVKNKSEL